MLGPDAFELSTDEGPSAAIGLDHREQFNVLFEGPVCLFDVGVQMADPFFPAHGKTSEIFPRRSAEQQIRNVFPLGFALF